MRIKINEIGLKHPEMPGAPPSRLQRPCSCPITIVHMTPEAVPLPPIQRALQHPGEHHIAGALGVAQAVVVRHQRAALPKIHRKPRAGAVVCDVDAWIITLSLIHI
eukprot:TRINITY_DN13144_c0_g1_i1.p1 TRINITY_DN13144_c0_g1~~TRINITY_DN13144_c0_g1_i1.p1  ORF type:complete len:106 (-),score=1.27 TRINITY_DN13144_c0_g1_i1:143-460(-)